MPKTRDPRVELDSDYIESAKYNNSLRQLLDDHPDGVPDSLICKILCISQEDLTSTYESAILKLKKALASESSNG